MADVTSGERDLAADFRVLVDTVLDRLEPVIRRLEAGAGEGGERAGCSWCPLCAAAAFLRGEQHDLLTLAGGEIEQLLTLVRDVLGEHAKAPHTADSVPHEHDSSPEATDESRDRGTTTTGSGEAKRKRVYEPITVTVKQ